VADFSITRTGPRAGVTETRNVSRKERALTKDRLIQWLCLFVAIVAATGSAMLVPVINRQRRDLQLSFDIEIGDAVPPQYELLAAMGSLRGIAVDIAWYRAEMLKQEGKFFESNTLAQFITTLQPRFPQVWSFHAWNLAYNISVETHTKEERWDWVHKGVRLLRDEGLVYNPTSVLLYKELAWILFHKIGKESDDAHWYYKRMWVQEWNELLGEPRAGKVGDEKNEDGWPIYQATRDFAAIAEAAGAYFADDRKVDPVSRFAQDHPSAAPLLAKMRQVEIELNADGLRRVGRLLILKHYLRDLSKLPREVVDRYDAKDKTILAILSDESLSSALDGLLVFWRAKVLLQDYHMKPAVMLKMMQQIGPFDWRHPVSHAAYFSYLGGEMAGELRDDTKIDILNTDRGGIHAAQSLTDGGSIVYDPLSGSLDLLPDPRFIHAYEIALRRAVEREKKGEWTGQGNKQVFASGHENFLLKAMLYAYLYGDVAEAKQYYKQARDDYGNLPHNLRTGRYLKPLDDLIISELNQDWDQQKVVRSFIEGMLRQGLMRGLKNNRMGVFDRFNTLAKRGYDRYQKERGYSNALTRRTRLGLPTPWRKMFTETYVNLMRTPGISLFDRSRVWRNTPIELQRQTYAEFRPQVAEQAQRQRIAFERAFPAPPGFVAPDQIAPQQADEQNPGIERQ